MEPRRLSRTSALRRASPLLPLLELFFIVGCGAELATEPEEIPVATGLEIQGPGQRLLVGKTVHVGATVKSSTGGAMPSQAIAFVSRDTTTLTVDSTGTVTAVRAGEAYVVATAGQFLDSALVQVVFDLLPGEGRARVRSGGGDRTILMPESQGIALDYLSRTEEDSWLVFGDNAGSPDTALVVVLPSDPDGKRVQLSAWDPKDMAFDEVENVQAYLWIDQDTTVLLVPLQGWIETSLEGALPAPGMRKGLMSARVVASGRAYRQLNYTGTEWTLTNATYDVVIDLRPTTVHQPVGTSSGQITGLTQPVTWTMREAWWGEDWGSRSFRLDVEDGPPDLSIGMPGTVSVDFGIPTRTDLASLEITDYEKGYQGTGTSGRVEITRYIAPPAPDLYGEIQGKVTVRGSGSPWSGGPSFDFDATFDFHAPVFPQGGGDSFFAPSAVARAATLGPAGRLRGLSRAPNDAAAASR